MEPRANAASQSDSPATGAATFLAQHTTIGIGTRSSCCSFLATQTMVCSKMKDKIWQKSRDKKHFIRDEIYWWQRERTLMGHAHILWVLLSAARIAVRALNCITYHGPLTRYVKLQVAHAPGMPGTFSPAADFKGNRKLAIPTCITAVRDARAVMHVGIAHLRWRGKRSRHSRRMRTCNFAYLARGPCRGASWGVERAMRTGFETKQFIEFMCVHFGRIINCDRIYIEFRVDKFYQHKFFGCDIKIYWCVLMPRLK